MSGYRLLSMAALVSLALLLGTALPSVAHHTTGPGRLPATVASDEDAASVVGRIGGQIARHEPDHYVGSVLDTGTGSAPRIYIKGQASAFVRDLVAEAGIPIEIVDGQPYSFTELEDRTIEVQQALLKLGLEDFSVAVDVAGAGRIPVRVRLTASTPSEAAIRGAVPADLRADVVVIMDEDGDWEPDGAAASPSPLASVVPSTTPSAGTSMAPTDAWGPMAMVRDPLRDTLDQGFGPGSLTIGPSCVTFQGEGWETTLVFRDWQVIWQPATATIVVGDPSGELLVLKTGDELVLGGYAAWDDDTTGEPVAAPWLVQPGPECPSDLWLVHSAAPASEGG